MRKHGSITSYEAAMRYGILRLSGRIYDLKRMGHPIETEIVYGKDRQKHWAKYSLS